MLEGPRLPMRKGGIREVTKTLNKGREGRRRPGKMFAGYAGGHEGHMHNGKVWFTQGEMVEEVKPMGRLGCLTEAELTTQVRLGC